MTFKLKVADHESNSGAAKQFGTCSEIYNAASSSLENTFTVVVYPEISGW